MTDIVYNRDLEPLERLLEGVRRSGDYFVQGALEVPLPRLMIEGVGVVSFPVPESQSREIIEQAERAPYGRGEETILDTSVREVWQLPAEKVRLEGKSWELSFHQMLEVVANGLGGGGIEVSAELYKLLV